MSTAAVTIEELSAFVDGEVAGEDSKRVGAHLDGCAHCAQLLTLWRSAGAELSVPGGAVIVARSGSRNLGPRPVLLVLVPLIVVILTVTAIAGSGLRITQFATESLRPAASSPATPEGLTAFLRLTLDEARARTGFALPKTESVGAAWRVTRADYAPGLGGGLLEMQLQSTRDAGVTASAVLEPLASRPVVPAAGLGTEEVLVGGTAVVLVHGQNGPVGPLPPSGQVSADSLAHRMMAVFENGPAAILLSVDDRQVTRGQLLALVDAWLQSVK